MATDRNLIFISYSQQDFTEMEQIRSWLSPVSRNVFEVWADPLIQAGTQWRREIDEALDRTAVAILLVSQDFLASEFIATVELPRLLEAERRGLITLICIPLRLSTWEESELESYQWIQHPDRPLNALSPAERDAVLIRVARRVGALARERASAVGPLARERAEAEALAAEPAAPDAPRATPIVPPGWGPAGALHGVPALPEQYIARPEELARVKQSLFSQPYRAVGITAAVDRLGLHGPGGIGKSVLAAALARDEEVLRTFSGGVFWVALGQEPDLVELQATLARWAGGAPVVLASVEEGREVLAARLAGRACLVVLDDVWDAAHIRAFDVLGARSRLLVTTRDQAVLLGVAARAEGITALSDEAALELLARWAGEPVSALPAAARGVAHACGGLPLALSVAGAQVRAGASWTGVLAALNAGRERFEDHPYASVFASLRLSVDILPGDERARYLELAVFPEDVRIPESMVHALWRHAGGLDARGARDLLDRLQQRALLERTRSGEVVVHDLLRHFLRISAADLPALHEALLGALAAGLPAGDGPAPAWHALPPDEPYPWTHLGFHLVAAGRSAELRELLLEPRWLQARLRASGLPALLSDFRWFPDDADLLHVARALSISAVILEADPAQLPSQLVGRLLDAGRPLIREMLARVRPWPAGPWLRPLSFALASPRSGLMCVFPGDGGPVLALSPDGRSIFTGHEGALRERRLETGEEVRRLFQRASEDNVLAITPDGRVIRQSEEGLEVEALEAGDPVGHRGWSVRAVTPDRKWAVSAPRNGDLWLWDFRAGRRVRLLDPWSKATRAVAVTPDGARALSASPRGLTVWELGSGRVVWSHRTPWFADAVALTADGRVAVAADGGDHTIRVWDVETGALVRTYAGHSDAVLQVVATPDGRSIISSARDDTVRVWELVPETRGGAPLAFPPEEAPPTPDQASPVHLVLFAPGGERAVTGSADGVVRVWDLGTGAVLGRFDAHREQVGCVALSPDGARALSGSYDGRFREWEIGTGRELRVMRHPAQNIKAVAVTPDWRWALAGTSYGTLLARSLDDPGEGRTLGTDLGWVTSLVVTADGRLAVSGSTDRLLRVWDLETMREVERLRGHPGRIAGVECGGDGVSLLSRSVDGTLIEWDLRTWEKRRVVCFDVGAADVTLAPGGRHAASVTADGRLNVWDVATEERVAWFTADGPLTCCAAAGDGLVFVAGDRLGRFHVLRLDGIQPGES